LLHWVEVGRTMHRSASIGKCRWSDRTARPRGRVSRTGARPRRQM